MIWFARSAALACAVAAGAVAAAQTVAVEEWDAPPEARALANPLNPTNPEHLKKGRGLFVRHCVTCHGEQGRGDGPSARLHARRSGYQPRDLSRSDVQTGLTDGEIFWKITKGIRGIMPAGERKMPEAAERWDVVNYVRTLAKEKQ